MLWVIWFDNICIGRTIFDNEKKNWEGREEEKNATEEEQVKGDFLTFDFSTYYTLVVLYYFFIYLFSYASPSVINKLNTFVGIIELRIGEYQGEWVGQNKF